LRSAATFGRVLAALDRLRDCLAVDHKIHMRFETMALDAVDPARVWIESGQVAMVSINDHFPMLNGERESAGALATLAKRSGIEPEAYRKLLETLAERQSEKPKAVAAVLEAVHRARLPAASHDDRTAEDRRANRALGCHIADFPTAEAAMLEARSAAEPIILGAPNVVRGGSHLSKGVSAATMAERRLCTVLASDYYYPALAAAAIRLWRRHNLDFAQAWALVSSAPADAAGLGDRGRIAADARADLVLVDVLEDDASVPTAQVLATMAGGHAVVHHRNGQGVFTGGSSHGRTSVVSLV
jgi:alpha-D-ribose 1-methylphosphonate 5-triphosphate diphosphatase